MGACDCLIGRYFVKERDFWRRVLHAAAVVFQSVADHQIRCFQHHVIPDYLLEHGLSDGYGGGFVFYYGKWAAHTVEKHSVASAQASLRRNATSLAIMPPG